MMRRGLVLTAAAVVVAANAWTLIAAWRNCREPGGGTLELTDRELRLIQVPWESTATLLEIRWNVLSETPADRGRPAWLGATKLAELGFDCTVPVGDPHAREHYASMPPALVFVVLEYEGEAWRQASTARKPTTRLFVVDAGRDAGQLRDRYPNTQTHAITRGVVRLSYQEHRIPEGDLLAVPRLQGWIETVLPSQIYVSQPEGWFLEELRERDFPASEPPDREPRFAITVSWGSNYEPWVRGVRRLAANSAQSEMPQAEASPGS